MVNSVSLLLFTKFINFHMQMRFNFRMRYRIKAGITSIYTYADRTLFAS